VDPGKTVTHRHTPFHLFSRKLYHRRGDIVNFRRSVCKKYRHGGKRKPTPDSVALFAAKRLKNS
jgi:hypothetical protein